MAAENIVRMLESNELSLPYPGQMLWVDGKGFLIAWGTATKPTDGIYAPSALYIDMATPAHWRNDNATVFGAPTWVQIDTTP